MFDWVLNTPLLLTMNREKGIALEEEVVWRYRAVYKKVAAIIIGRRFKQTIGIQFLRNWNKNQGWLNKKCSSKINFVAINFIIMKG